MMESDRLTLFMTTSATTDDLSDSTIQRTENFAKRVYERESLPTEAVLKIVAKSNKKERRGERNRSFVQFTFHAIDGNDDIVTLKLNTSLNASASLITRGSVIKIMAFSPIYFCFDNPEDRRVVILVSNFDVLGIESVDEKYNVAPKQEERLTVKK